VPAADVFADVIEAEGLLGKVAPHRDGVLAPAWHALLTPLALAVQGAAQRRRKIARREKVEQGFRDKDAAAEEAR